MAPVAAATAPPTDGPTVWLSYAELSDRLGITGESARNLVRRKHWPRRPGNDGTQRVGVPREYLDERSLHDGPHSGQDDGDHDEAGPRGDTDGAGHRAAIEALQAHVADLRDRLAKADALAEQGRLQADAERTRADEAHARADKITAELHDLAQRFAGSIEDARTRESTLAEKLDAARAEMAALRARPWWRRLAG